MRTLNELRRWAIDAPPGTVIPATALVDVMDVLEDEPSAVPGDLPASSWRERLWTVPAETRLGVAELAEALDRPKSFVYARTGPKSKVALPCRKLDGVLVFHVGEVREWIRTHEEIVSSGPQLTSMRSAS